MDTPCTVSYPEQTAQASASFLAEGDSVAVISPSALPSQEQVDATIEGLKQWGYVPVEGKHVRQDNRTLADCVEDLTWALQDPTTKAVFCVRGGYGASEVLGTAYDCTKADQPFILFLEDVEEDVQHVHRYLAVLKHMGVLDRAAGIVFGEWTDVPTDMDDYDGSSRGGTFTSMSDMISRQYLADLDIPVAFGFPAGHGETNYPLLMGAKAHLDASDGSFTLSW